MLIVNFVICNDYYTGRSYEEMDSWIDFDPLYFFISFP